MENEKLPIKFFAPREVDELRIEGNKNPEKPKWVLQGEELKQRADCLQLSLDELEAEFSTRKSSPVPFSFIAKLQSDATAKSKREDITNLFQQKSFGGVVGLTDTNKLIVALNSLEELKEISNRIKDYESNDYAISCIEDFEEFVPYIVKEEKECNYKIKLVDYQNYEQNLAMRRLLEYVLNKEGIDYIKTDYSEEYYIYKLRNLTEKALDNLEKTDIFNALFSIEPMPKYMVSLDCLESDNDISIKQPEDEKEYITIGVLDNGIANIPHLSPWMDMKRWSPYPETSINPTHGTFVAGIALYGDECEGKNWVSHKGLKIFDSTVFPDTTKEGLDEDELIANIKDAIQLYHAKVERDTTKRHILNPVGRQGAQNLFLGNLFSKTKMKNKTGDFALRERLQIQYNDKYYPVKKYAIDLSELTDKKRLDYLTADKKWFLFLQGVYRSHIEKLAQLKSFQLSQEFCLVLTIRDPLQKEKVYDGVSKKLDEYNFWHSNIKVSTDVTIPL